jgi:hypothetical protein
LVSEQAVRAAFGKNYFDFDLLTVREKLKTEDGEGGAEKLKWRAVIDRSPFDNQDSDASVPDGP